MYTGLVSTLLIMVGVGTAYREMGRALETIETVGTDESLTLTSTQPESQEFFNNEELSIRFGIQIPFIRPQSLTENTTITPCDVQLTEEGSLYIECKATINQQDTPNHDQPSREDENSDNSIEPAQTSSTKDHTDVEGKGSTIDTDAEESVEPSESDLTDEPQETTDSEKGPQSDNDEGHTIEDSNNSTNRGADSHESSDQNSESVPSTIKAESASQQLSRPPYRDPDRLEAVYEEYDTFAEMTDALEVDVTPQTVRRYMIQHGIHEPASRSGPTSADSLLEMNPDEIPALNGDKDNHEDDRETANQTSRTDSSQNATSTPLVTDGNGAKRDSESESSQEHASKADESEPSEATTESSQAEGDEGDKPSKQDEVATSTDNVELRMSDIDDVVDLPSNLTLSEVKTVVQEVKTLYEAQQRLDLERDETRRLLQELNLLDLVQGRLATRGLEERTVEDINRRIQSAAVAGEGISN